MTDSTTVRYRLDADGRPADPAVLLTDGPPFAERLVRDLALVCSTCGADTPHGLVDVEFSATTALGLRPSVRVHDTDYTCVDCLHERSPDRFPQPTPDPR